MPLIETMTVIKADLKTCFDLARNIDIHQKSLQYSNKKAIGGKVAGLIELDEWVCFEAKHLGFVQHLTSKITEFDAPNYFVDEMILGAFKSFRHEHHFHEMKNETIMVDVFNFESPYGVLGKFANWLFLEKYIANLLATRNRFLKQYAEEASE